MRLSHVAPLRGNPFAGPGPSYQSYASGATTPSAIDTQSQCDGLYLETPMSSPRDLCECWQMPQYESLSAACHQHWCMSQCEPSACPNVECSGAKGAVPVPKGGHEGWCMPHHEPPTALNIECSDAKGAAPFPKGGHNGLCMQQHEVPTPQPPRQNSWCVSQYEPLTSPSSTGFCIPPDCHGAKGTVPVGYYMQVPMVIVIPMFSCYAQDLSQRSKADVPAPEVGLHTDTTLNGSAGGWHENAGKDDDPMQLQTTRSSVSPIANVTSLREVPAGFTTLVVRNIPARFSQKMLLREFGRPDGSFDFFYQPYSFRDSKTVGIAFINFRSHQAAVCFQEMWHRRFLCDHGHTKFLDVAAATIQGVASNLKQFKPKSISRLNCVGMLPAFFDNQGHRLNSISQLRRHGILA